MYKVRFQHLLIPLMTITNSCGEIVEDTDSLKRASSDVAVYLAPASIELGPAIRLPARPRYDQPIVEFDRDLVFRGPPSKGIEGKLTSPPRLLVDSQGRMIVGDTGTCTIYLLGRDGSIENQAGGKGKRSGKFESISDMWWMEEDSEFWVLDSKLGRISRLDGTGELLGLLDVTRVLGSFPFMHGLGDGRIAARGSPVHSMGRAMSRIALLNSEFHEIMNFGLHQWQQNLVVAGRDYGPLPYLARTDLLDYQDDGLLLADYQSGTICLVSEDGVLVKRITSVGNRRGFPVPEKEWFRKTRAQGLNPLENADRYLPEALPAIGHVRVDSKGVIWIGHFRTNREYMQGTRPQTYDLITSDGIWLVRQVTPAAFRIIGTDHAYSVGTGLLDGDARIERWKITRKFPESARQNVHVPE